MKAYIKSISEKAWLVVLTRWEPPMIDIENGKLANLKVLWNVKGENFANANSKALYAIFCGVDLQEFKRIAKCTVAFALSEEYSNTKLVRKVLRSLLETFSLKVTAIEEAKDLESLIIDELIGFFQIFKMNLEDAKCCKTSVREPLLSKWVEAKETLLAEEHNKLAKVKKALIDSKLMREKFISNNSKLDEILAARRKDLSKEGLGYSEMGKCLKLVLINHIKKNITPYKVIFHYCGAFELIRLQCFKMLHDLRWRCTMPKEAPTPHNTSTMKKHKRVWVKETRCILVAHWLLKSTISGVWYFDSGCSWHMTGNQSYLTDLKHSPLKKVTFGKE
ncbi:hypothetical protein Goshw_004406 [Gossypium schwendimanii]|uniref:Retrovirus-related Pol polyprotein from transposon TNT 1-94-like beta-barrel domain-containing protein n=1 Tax=Gossypium schwendimanii TaxID=34291 RepID=A0A7J9LDJ1_GOSSC|nr:hypothetical protein [Gossypium schwendimanii]